MAFSAIFHLCLALSLSLLPMFSAMPFIAFGNHFCDVGTNNFVPGAPQSNHTPYGRIYPGHKPTGRACDGSIFADAVAQLLSLPQPLRPYLDPSAKAENLTQGISFASTGAGIYDPTSAATGAVPLSVQLQQFDAYKQRVNFTIHDAFFLVAGGEDDVALFLKSNASSLLARPAAAYEFVTILLERLRGFLTSLIARGARTIAVANLPPMSKLPYYISTLKPALNETVVNGIVTDYNVRLATLIISLQLGVSDGNLVYLDFYTSLQTIILNAGVIGFDPKTLGIGCCGLDGTHFASTCNASTPTCSEGSDFLFFDCFHLTERGHFELFKILKSLISRYVVK